MRNFKIFVIFFISTFIPYQVSQGCGPHSIPFEGYSFINPNIVNTEATYAPFFLRFNDLYTSYDSIAKIQVDENLTEWNERFCNLFQLAELRRVIYTANNAELRMIHNASKKKKVELPKRLRTNNFAIHLAEEKCLEVIKYLMYAKDCEKHVVPTVGWATPKRDVQEMKRMIERGEKEFRKTDSDYVRLRYAYQIIRLAHYAKDYKLVLELHDDLLPKAHANPSILDYWIMGHKAGALLKLGKRVEASYLYSIIFSKSLAKRQSAYQSFSIQNDKEWEACLLLCRSDEERAMLYTLRANNNDSKAVEEMEKIYELYPLTENLELLALKEIGKLERDLLGKDFNDRRLLNKRYHKLPRKKVGDYLYRMKRFANRCAKEEKVRNVDFWKLMAAYMTYLGGDYYEADRDFKQIKETLTTDNKTFAEQVDVFRLALKISSLEDEIDGEDENEIGTIIKDNPLYWKYKDFPDFVNDKLAYIYGKMEEKGKAFRVHHTLRALKMNPNREVIDDLLKICNKEDKSSLEIALVKKDNLTTIKEDLLMLKGKMLFNNGQMEAALEAFRDVPRNHREPMNKFNPFHEHFIDCIHCPVADTLVYEQAGVIEKMLELEYQGRAHLRDGAGAFYQLGNAYYNLSYFGDSWNLMDNFRSGNNWQYANKDNRYITSESELGNVELMSLKTARRYYNTTLELAKNPELAARACFMLAKCDLNDYYLDPESEYTPYDNEIPRVPEEYFKHYAKLIDEYSETDFYKMIIEECKFFEAYALK